MTETSSTPRRRAWLIPAIVAVVALVGIGVGVAGLVSDDDNNSQATSDASLVASVQQACQDWMGSYDGERPNSDWCAGMGTWMRDQMGSGNLRGQMMWGDPDKMRGTCRQWMASNATPTAGRDDWCDSMVTWMSDHMDQGWDDWMMNGGMIGR